MNPLMTDHLTTAVDALLTVDSGGDWASTRAAFDTAIGALIAARALMDATMAITIAQHRRTA